MAQLAAEQVVQEQLAALREQGQKLPLQAAMLVSDTRSGELLAMVGGLGDEAGGFNRARAARTKAAKAKKVPATRPEPSTARPVCSTAAPANPSIRKSWSASFT